jgi:hypothetical protein
MTLRCVLGMWTTNSFVPMCNANDMDNLIITQHWDTLHYATIQRGGY